MKEPSAQKRPRIPLLLWLLIPAAALLFCGANAHLIYVAFASQPECVSHLKAPDPSTGRFRAANSDC
ncbi:hypothetical protein FJ426_07250 [Mesorhizobium sp. B2-6-4]|nr:hypothetical protein FJ426_07250 [Mesorhizobium sp. B2-6-4]